MNLKETNTRKRSVAKKTNSTMKVSKMEDEAPTLEEGSSAEVVATTSTKGKGNKRSSRRQLKTLVVSLETLQKNESEDPTPEESTSNDEIVATVSDKENKKPAKQPKKIVESKEDQGSMKTQEDKLAVPAGKRRGKGKKPAANLDPVEENEEEVSEHEATNTANAVKTTDDIDDNIDKNLDQNEEVLKKEDEKAAPNVKKAKGKAKKAADIKTDAVSKIKGKKKGKQAEPQASSSSTSNTAKPPKRSILQLKITLRDIQPPIWRRIQVLNTATFSDLHSNIQEVMGWHSCHLHQFLVKKSKKSNDIVYIKASDGFEFEDDCLPKSQKDRDVKLSKYLSAVGDSVIYEYDFGDSWEHNVVVEKILPPPPPKSEYPKCLAGKRACPPEDCGGVGGYQRLLDVLKDPEHGEHDEMRQWIEDTCPGFEPEKFSKQGIFRKVWMWVGPGMEGY